MREAIHHPGARKNPFMRIAFDSQWAGAGERVRAYVSKRLTKEGIEMPDDGNKPL